MDVSTDDLSAFLNRAWQRAKDGANTLPDELLAQQQSVLELLAAGSIASLGKNSTSQSYAYYSPGTLTHRQIANIFTTLIRYYEVVKAKIVEAAAEASVSLTDFDFDQPVYDLLNRYFQVSAQAARLPDIRDLRIPISWEGRA